MTQPAMAEAPGAEIHAPADNRLSNPDLAPVPLEKRTWRLGSIAALWISMSACIPTYMLASSLIGGGMNWWQAILTIFLGNAIVLIPMILNAHAGTAYGIPFPVFCRASFGTLGANIPALLRALVACGWFGIQTWIGGNAIFKIMAVFFPTLAETGAATLLGITTAQLVCFLFFWGINMAVVYKGIDCIRWLLNIKAPLLIALGLLLLWWAYREAGGFGPILSQPSAFEPGQPKAGQFWAFSFPGLTGMIGFWATLSLNIPDFTRYAVSQRDQILGQALGLPLTMALYAFIGVAVTSATTIMPWKLVADPSGYIFTWLIGYSALLGPIGGIMIADYFVWRRRKLNVAALYSPDGEYTYRGGFSWVAIIALVAGALPSLPGFLAHVQMLDAARVAPWLSSLYSYAWFVGFALAFVIYLALRKMAPNR